MFDSDSIYDPGPIRPVVKIRENLAVWSTAGWGYYTTAYIEPMPRSTPLVAEMVTLSGATALAANGTIVKRLLPILQLNTGDLLHLRFEPLDNVEGLLWEVAGQGRFLSRGVQARVDLNTKKYDPYLSTTTFWIIGNDRDMNLEVRNPMGRATPTARFAFWGFKYILTPLAPTSGANAAALARGDTDEVKRAFKNPFTWIPAEGRAS